MHIVVATDDNFVQHCAVMLSSLISNNKQHLNIYLLTEGLTDKNDKRLQNIVESTGNKYVPIVVNSELFRNLPMPDLESTSHISLATYYRIIISLLIPSHIEKVIYLDCDIIIRKSIKELWETNIEDYAIAAVYQMTLRTVSDALRLGFNPKYGYFNAGVLLINMNYWRQNNVTKQLLEYLNKNHDQIIFHDQDALNGVLYDKCLKIDCRWNMLSIYFIRNTLNIVDVFNGDIIENYNIYKKSFPKEAHDPTIIHFVSKPKPWDPYCTHPFRIEYYKYLKLTPWNNFIPKKRLQSNIYRVLKRIKNKFINPENSYFNIK